MQPMPFFIHEIGFNSIKMTHLPLLGSLVPSHVNVPEFLETDRNLLRSSRFRGVIHFLVKL